ncbi:UPF0193 protein EVG1 homolog [Bombyx mandarina]|uniref:UPF0193 protein EVG1 homolog n=1 Tax=Bombyx mandarina TaxID=7092 RepID=A0A6J2JFV2_BOMMA|nr:UPF0193 protein EVG1 homolog [Bombyx mandarina]
MEKPDEKGFVNVTWPSRNVPHGGIFHTKTVHRTPAQQEFIKVLLEESKLSIAQRHNDVLKLRKQEVISNTRDVQDRFPLTRPRTSRRRSLSAIRASGIFDEDVYRPIKRGEDREVLKDRLSRLMSDGDCGEAHELKSKPVEKPAKKTATLPSNKEMWNEILNQIRERVEWLSEMEQLGEAGPHRDIVNDQIAERMRALDVLGIDSEPSTARTIASSSGSTTGVNKSVKKDTFKNTKQFPLMSSTEHEHRYARHGLNEENVASYEKMSLKWSPRRRV